MSDAIVDLAAPCHLTGHFSDSLLLPGVAEVALEGDQAVFYQHLHPRGGGRSQHVRCQPGFDRYGDFLIGVDVTRFDVDQRHDPCDDGGRDLVAGPLHARLTQGLLDTWQNLVLPYRLVRPKQDGMEQEPGQYCCSLHETLPHDKQESRPYSGLGWPLLLTLLFLLGGTAVLAAQSGNWSDRSLMADFMGWVVLGFFKLLDRSGFAAAFAQYDLLASRWYRYALAYPFLEVGLGLCFLLRWVLLVTTGITLLLMLAGAAGVAQSLGRKQQIPCACLRIVIALPMSTAPLIEDLAMLGSEMGSI